MNEILPSWNEGRARQSILDFVARITKKGGTDHIPPDAASVKNDWNTVFND
jgi:hypothetical protein